MVKEIHYRYSSKKSSIEFFVSRLHENQDTEKKRKQKLEICIQFNVWAYGDIKLIEHKLKSLLLIPAKKKKRFILISAHAAAYARMVFVFFLSKFLPSVSNLNTERIVCVELIEMD